MGKSLHFSKVMYGGPGTELMTSRCMHLLTYHQAMGTTSFLNVLFLTLDGKESALSKKKYGGPRTELTTFEFTACSVLPLGQGSSFFRQFFF